MVKFLSLGGRLMTNRPGYDYYNHNLYINIYIFKVKEFCQHQFGKCFTYTDIYMAKLEDGEYVTIEEFIDGEFTKYLNNTGLVCGSRSTDECKKAECLAHYSYEKSSEKLMLLDIQGSMYTLFDPEIAVVL